MVQVQVEVGSQWPAVTSPELIPQVILHGLPKANERRVETSVLSVKEPLCEENYTGQSYLVYAIVHYSDFQPLLVL